MSFALSYPDGTSITKDRYKVLGWRPQVVVPAGRRVTGENVSLPRPRPLLELRVEVGPLTRAESAKLRSAAWDVLLELHLDDGTGRALHERPYADWYVGQDLQVILTGARPRPIGGDVSRGDLWTLTFEQASGRHFLGDAAPQDWLTRPGGTPPRPAAPLLTSAFESLTARWSIPLGVVLTAVLFRYRKAGEAWPAALVLGAGITMRAVPGLDAGARYEVQVAYRNVHGDSPWSAVSAAFTTTARLLDDAGNALTDDAGAYLSQDA